MNDQPTLGQDAWDGRANAYRDDRIAQLRRRRQAAIRRVAQRRTDIQDLMEKLLTEWERLDERLPRVAQALDLYYIAGCSTADAAALLGVSVEVSARDLRLGRAWLKRVAAQLADPVHPGLLELRAEPFALTGPV